MASILINAGQIASTRGYARHVVFSEELGVCREFPGEKEILPRSLPLQEYLAMQYFAPPEEAMRTFGSIQGSINAVNAIFGGGGREFSREWVPTSARWEDCRAWVLRSHWSLTYSQGTHLEHTEYGNDAVAAAWFHIPTIRDWAAKLFSSPLGRMILQREVSREYGGTILLGNDQLIHELDDLARIDPAAPECDEGGVFITYFVNWGERLVRFRRNIPKGWVVENQRCHFEGGISLPATVYRNGAEEVVVLNESGAEEKKHVEFSLPADKTPPRDVAGDFAAFFVSDEAIVNFCLRHNVFPNKPFLGPHAPAYDQQGGHLLAMSEEWAKIAWSEGATPLPQTVGELPPLAEWTVRDGIFYGRRGTRASCKIGEAAGAYCNGQIAEGKNVNFSDGYGGNCHGWLRVPSDRKVTMSFGITVRDPGDPYRGYHETVVYTDGRLVLAER